MTPLYYTIYYATAVHFMPEYLLVNFISYFNNDFLSNPLQPEDPSGERNYTLEVISFKSVD